jgi:hypothetical protein
VRIGLVGTTPGFRRFGPPHSLPCNDLLCENRGTAGRIGEVGLRVAAGCRAVRNGRQSRQRARRRGWSALHSTTAKPCSAKSNACRPTPQPRSRTCCVPRAFSTGTRAATAGCGSSQSSRPSGVAHRSSHASTARRRHLRLPVLPSAALAVIISGKRRCASLEIVWFGTSAVPPSGGRAVAIPMAPAAGEVGPNPGWAKAQASGG